MKKRFLIVFVLIGSQFIRLSAQDWHRIISVQELCDAYPDQMKKMVEAIDLNYPGLESVKTAWSRGDLVKSCSALLEYYETGSTASHLRRQLPEASLATVTVADTILNNVFVIQNVRGQVPWGEDGHRDWYYKGPNNDREWAWLSNRHSQINQVLDAYFQTGNPKYVEYIDRFLRDFIIKSWPYPGVKSSTSVWRGLEVAARAKVWSRVFYSLQNSTLFSPATRLLMLSSLPDHAHYNRQFHAEKGNWLTMEISALATVATNFPEYSKSEKWLDYAVKTMTESMKGQVYPDGVQTELTSHYHTVALRNFVLFKEICERAHYPLPAFFNETIEKMYGYTAHTVRPDGYGILNNDGDRTPDVKLILEGAKTYNQPGWEYIATNGKKGTKPTDGPSYFYPWAGQLISRSGYDSGAQWSFFDVGPWGSGHQHNDKLHISISAFGRDLLVDAGRFAYTGAVADKFRGYAKGSQGHNVILVDGHGQNPGPKLAAEPVSDAQWKITDEKDYAWSSFDHFAATEGTVEHSRMVNYVRGQFWIVIDKITTDRPREIDALWHWHPDCKVAIKGDQVATLNERGNLQIIPLGEQNWEVKLVRGQEEPELQGWYSEEYNKFEPNPTTIFTTTIDNTTIFGWLLFPSEKPVKNMKAHIVSSDGDEVTVGIIGPGKDEQEVTLSIAIKE